MAGHCPTDPAPETEHEINRKWDLKLFLHGVFICVYVAPHFVQVVVKVQTKKDYLSVHIYDQRIVMTSHTREVELFCFGKIQKLLCL